MVGGLDEGVHLPNLVNGKAGAEGRHLRAFAALDHGLEESLVAELRREEVRPAGARALMTHQALALIDIAAGRNRLGLAEERVV